MDNLLFGVLPYVLAAVAVVGALWRFRRTRDTVTSGSTQFLEGRLQFWGAVPWHYAVLLVLLAHLGAIFLPHAVASLLASPVRLVTVEVTGLALGSFALFGLVVLGARRLTLRIKSSVVEWLVVLTLLVQVATGVWTAATLRWGLAWFVHLATPWLASLVRLSPRVDLMASLPWVVKIHALCGLLVLALIPYTRLAHVFVAPVAYLWRRPQVVVWLRPQNTRNEVTR
jgi:nitrate reductase gamma subunit